MKAIIPQATEAATWDGLTKELLIGQRMPVWLGVQIGDCGVDRVFECPRTGERLAGGLMRFQIAPDRFDAVAHFGSHSTASQ